MSIETKKPELTKESYTTAGAGALVGGAATYGVINNRLTRLAKETVDAFSGKSNDCDAFIKKHDELISKAVDSKKGFFGKINKVIEDISKTNGDDAIDAIAKSTSDVVDSYRNTAAKKLNTKLSGDALTQGIDDLGNKLISKDVLKSFKNVTRFENIVKISGVALAGAIGACILKSIITAALNKKAAMKDNSEVEKIASELRPEAQTMGVREDGMLFPVDAPDSEIEQTAAPKKNRKTQKGI